MLVEVRNFWRGFAPSRENFWMPYLGNSAMNPGFFFLVLPIRFHL